MNIKFYMIDTHACGHYRGEIVAREINKYPNHRMDCKTNIMFSDYPGTNVMVFQRQNRNLLNVQFARERGIATIYEIDDDIWNIAPVFKAYGDKCLRPDDCEAIMRECDIVTVSTPELAQVVKERLPEKNVVVVHNAIDMEMWESAYIERQTAVGNEKETVTIGWMASQSHLMDAPLVGEVLRDLMLKHKHLRLHFIGWIDMKSFLGDIMAPFKDRIQCDDWAPVSQLADAMKDFDIGLLPLVDHPWNRSKSELKYLQYSALGIPAVASPLPCYTRTITDGAGFIAENNSPGSWYKHLDCLICDAELRRCVGARARQNVYLKHNIKDHFRTWLDTFELVRKMK